MKLLWIDLNSSYAHASLALPALHAQMAEDNSIEWTVVSATINENTGIVAEEIYHQKPDIVAGTAWLFNHEALMHILARVKALLPMCTVVLGGPEFLGDNEQFLRTHPFVQCVFRGEGEEVFPQWIACRDKPELWKGISGLCYFDADGHYTDQGIARVIHFTELIPPEHSVFFNWNKPFVQLETTRGCFNTCAFCVSGGEKPVRTLDIETIRKRLDNIRSHGIQNVRVLDRTFNYSTRHAKALLELFRTYYPDIRFHLEIHPALLDEELKEELKQLPPGLLHLEAGIQSLREEVLQASHRKGSLKASLQGLRYLCSLSNMETHADLIAGLPHYQLEQIFEDVHTLAEYHVGEIQLESLKLLPGTAMRLHADELGICYSPYPPYEVLRTDSITPGELQTARRLSRLLDAYYNTRAWQKVTRTLMLQEKKFLHHFLTYLTTNNLIDQPMSLEKRGMVLYAYCKQAYPNYASDVTRAWIEAGMSLKKEPAEHVHTKRLTPPAQWQVTQGIYRPDLRLCFLPQDPAEEEHGWWYGFESQIQKAEPVFKAQS